MPNFSGVWNLKEQIQAIAAGRWTGVPTGELYAWGLNADGQLGDGTAVNRSSPVQIGNLTNWAQVSTTNRHTVAIKKDGGLYAWGRNSSYWSGQLGDGTIVDRSSPVQIGALTNWAQVSAGYSHTASVKTDGTLWAWGINGQGQLGNGTTIARSSPVQVGTLTNWAQVSAGSEVSASVKTDGTLWAWGLGSNGALGQNSTISQSSPVQVGALTNWAQVSTSNHTTAITTGGELYAWGLNFRGQLGDGTTVNKSSPVQIGALTNWAQVSAGSGHTAAVKTDGTMWTWGSGFLGRLGISDTVDRSSPVQVGALTNWAQVAAGRGAHTASVKTDGTLWTWGLDNQGQLGVGPEIENSSPVQVGALTSWAQVAVGGYHTTAILQGTTN